MKFEDFDSGEEVEDFAAMLEESFKKADSRSDLIEGVIVKINEDEDQAIIDIGRKNEAFLPLDQLRDAEGTLTFKEGDTIDVVVTGNRGERPMVSHDMAKKRAALKEFIKEYDDEQEYIIDGVVTKKNKGGYVVECDGLEFFMPRTLS
jgi:small subunit ribosomal protein S1